MKKYFLFFVLIIISISCSNQGDTKSIHVTGKLLNQVTSAPIPNAKIYYRVIYISGSGEWAYDTEISNGFTITDSNGEFNADLKYISKLTLVFEFYKLDDEFSTEILNAKQNFTLAELIENPHLDFYAREWEKLRIKINNTAPFDNNDAIEVSIYQGNTNYVNSPIYEIINYGVINQPYNPGTVDLRPYWIGNNINSELFIHVQNDTTYQIFWYVRKNGLGTNYQSGVFNTISNQENFYQINF